MAYCIMRMAKLKSQRDVVMSLQHNTRDRMPKNADESRTPQNPACTGTEAAVACYRDLMPEKVRKNAVHAVELVMTASPEFAGDWTKYLADCDAWATGLFGKENLLHVAHHHDELTPHTHIIFVPLKDGKLNAKSFIGGARDRMAELQEDFFRKVGMSAGLERGRSREETRARHTPHTLAAAAAKLEERGKKVEEVAAGLRDLLKEDPREIKARLQRYENQTPTDLRMLAKGIEAKGCRTLGEFRKVMDAEKQQKQQQITQGRKR